MSSYHYYSPEGRLVHPLSPKALVSPTTILSIRKKQFLEDWQRNVGYEAADKKSQESRDKGTHIHAVIEQFLKSKLITNEVEEYDFLIGGFIRWYDKYKPETVGIEVFVHNDHLGYAGRVDYICKIAGELWIIDWKTSKNLDQGMELQLAAYRQAWFEMTGKYAKTGIVQLTDQIQRGYRFKEYDGNIQDFINHKKVYDYAVHIGEIRFYREPDPGVSWNLM